MDRLTRADRSKDGGPGASTIETPRARRHVPAGPTPSRPLASLRMSPRVLVVEDETSISEPLAAHLAREGFTPEIAGTIDAAREAIGRDEPDVILLDVMLPDGDGRDLCRDVRAHSDVPIVMLTARGEEVDRIVGLELGADDYVVKPFSAGELVARIRAIQRRGRAAGSRRAPITVGRLTLDPASRSVTKDGVPIELAAKEFDLLKMLMSRAGEVVGREEIMDEVWDPHWFGPTKTLDVHISWLRKKIEDEPSAPGVHHDGPRASGSVSRASGRSLRMKVRTRLVASFAYVLLVVIVALTVPLAIVLRDRARSELEALTLTNAQTIGAVLNRRSSRRRPSGAAAARPGRGAIRRRRRRTGRRPRRRRDRPGRLRRRGRGRGLRHGRAAGGRAGARLAGDAPMSGGARTRGATSPWERPPSSTRASSSGAVRISRGVQTVQENVGRATAAIAAVALGGLARRARLGGRPRALDRSPDDPSRDDGAQLRRGRPVFAGGADRGGRGGEGAGALVRRDGGSDGAHGPLAARVRRERLPPAPHAAHGDQAAARGRDRRHDRSEDSATSCGRPIRRSIGSRRSSSGCSRWPPRSRRGASHGPTWAMPSIEPIARWSERAAQASSTLSAQGLADAWAVADRDDLDQVLDVLIDNALRYAPGPIEVRATEHGDRVGVSVDGPRSRDPRGRGLEGHGALLPRPRRAHGRLRARARDRAGARRAVGRGIVGGRRPERRQDRRVVPAGRPRPGLAEP